MDKFQDSDPVGRERAQRVSFAGKLSLAFINATQRFIGMETFASFRGHFLRSVWHNRSGLLPASGFRIPSCSHYTNFPKSRDFLHKDREGREEAAGRGFAVFGSSRSLRALCKSRIGRSTGYYALLRLSRQKSGFTRRRRSGSPGHRKRRPWWRRLLQCVSK